MKQRLIQPRVSIIELHIITRAKMTEYLEGVYIEEIPNPKKEAEVLIYPHIPDKEELREESKQV